MSYQGYPEAYQDLALGRIDYVVNVWLSLQTIAKEKPDTFEVGQAVSKPTYIAWPVVEGQHRTPGADERVPARRAQGRLDVRAAEEVFQTPPTSICRRCPPQASDPGRLWDTGDYLALAAGAANTIAVSVLAIALGNPLGLGLALIRWGKSAGSTASSPRSSACSRATPSVTLVLLIYFALPTIGLEVPRFRRRRRHADAGNDGLQLRNLARGAARLSVRPA